VLREKGKVRFNRDFLGFTGLKDSAMSAILKRNSSRPANLPEKFYDPLLKKWDISPEYLNNGKGPMFNPIEKEPSLKELNDNIKLLIQELKKYNAR